MFKTGALDSVAGAYVDENTGTSTPGTRLEADDRNIIQDEIVSRIEGAGGTLDAAGVFTNNDQLHESIKKASGVIIYKTASGTYAKPAGLNFIEVIVIGGGGGGGGVDGQGAGNWAPGQSGGGGGYSFKKTLAASLAASETVTIGAGGAGGAAGANNGVTGGTTSLGTHLQATGGVGGDGTTGNNAITTRPGALYGVGSLGDLNLPGFAAEMSVDLGDGDSQVSSGNGGGSQISGGALSTTADSDGNDAAGYGGGGSGATVSNVTTDYAGGDGAPGIMIIKEFF